MSKSLEGVLGSRRSNVPLCHSWDMALEGALALGMSVAFFAAFEAGPKWLPDCWLMEAWSHVGQWLKCGFWSHLVGPSLALPLLRDY